MQLLTFLSPGWLVSVPFLAPLVWYLCRRRTLGFKLLQTGIVLLLILAAARPEIGYDSLSWKRLILLEQSCAASALLPEHDTWEIRRYSGSTAAALAAAALELPDGGGSILLAGPLQESDHALDAVLETLARRRISVTARPSDATPATSPGVRLREIDLPNAAHVGATVPMKLELDLPKPGEHTLVIRTRSGEIAALETVTLPAGRATASLRLVLPEPGLFRGTLEIDGVPCGTVALHVRGAFRAVLFSQNPGNEAAAFSEVFQNAVQLETYRPGMALDEIPLLIFGAGSLAHLPETLQREIIRQAERGAGILAVAGREAVFAEDAVLPEFARLFPTRYPGVRENRIPTVALAVVIDTSGSMRGPRLDLARETARLAIANLQEHDLAGVVEFHGARRWAAPLQSAANQFSLMRALNRLNAGGGTVILPAIHEAFYALRNTDARLKHLLILTDGGVEYGDFETIIRRMARCDITVSTVLVGPGDSDFLSRLAMWGGGRFYRASGRFALPELHFRQQENQPLPPDREEPLRVLVSDGDPLTAELPPDLQIGGIVRNTLCEDAKILLEAGGVPLLAVRRNAPGKTAVWNSEWNGTWSRELLRSPETAAMLTALARTLPDTLRFSGITAWNRSILRDLDFEFECARPAASLRISVTRVPDGAPRFWRIDAAGNNTFRFRLPDLPEGVYQLNVEGFMEPFYFVSRRAPTTGEPDLARIDELNRMAVPESTEPVRKQFPLSAPLAALAAGLFLLQLGWRRWGTVALLCGTLALHGASFGESMRAGLGFEEAGDYRAAARSYRQAAGAAENDADHAFAEMLERETGRRAGDLPPEAVPVAAAPGNGDAIRHALLDGDRELALRLYAEKIAVATTCEALAELADTAARQGLFPPAQDALRKALAIAEEPDWSALFQLAALHRQAGSPRKAVEELRDATMSPTVPAAVLLTAGDLCEQSGDPAAAAEFYRRSGSEEAQMRLAQLAEVRGDADEAAALWRKLAVETSSPLRSGQAVERLVELYRKQNRLPELFVSSKEQKTDPVLRRIHLRALVAAGEREKLFAALAANGTPEEELRYRLELRDYANAAGVLLRQLADATLPVERRRSFLRQLAMIAVETKDSILAANALRQLAENAPEDAAHFEFVGAIRQLTGDFSGAAAAYDRALELAPEKSELLLLRGKARCDAGESAAVLQSFAEAIPRETDPEKFGVLIDGLLNFNAPRPMLKNALREVLERLRREPETLFFHQLAEDLAEELGDRKLQAHLERLQMIVAPERRSMLMQKRFLELRQEGNVPEALFFGRLLLAYGDTCSPEIYRELGALLVENRLYAEAEHCMRNADRVQETDANLAALAVIYADNGRFAEAERLYRELLALSPNRIDLLESYAKMLEYQGRIADAAARNFQALQLLCRSRNTSVSRQDRHFPALLRLFVNQAVFQQSEYRSRIDAEIKNAPNDAQKQMWGAVRERLDALTGVLKNATAARPHTPRRQETPAAREIVARLRDTDPQRAVELLRVHFARFSGSRREFAWRQLVDAFDYEPQEAVTAFLRQELEHIPFSAHAGTFRRLPFAAALKSAYAEAALTRFPESLPLQVSAARMRHLAGDGDGARMLAELICDTRDADAKPPEIAELRQLHELLEVYADAPGEPVGAGRAALREMIAIQDEKRATLGDSPFRLLLAGILRAGNGEYDAAQTFFGRVWDADRNAYPALWLLNENLKESGGEKSWAELLLKQPPTDQTARTLYAIRLLPFLRQGGRDRETRELLALLPDSLRLRERLLLAYRSGNADQLAALFPEFLHGSVFRLRDTVDVSGGIQGWRAQKQRSSDDLLIEIAGRTPHARAFLEYRLQGLLPQESAFLPIWNTLRRMPEDDAPDTPTRPATLATLLLRATLPAAKFSEAEETVLRNLIATGELAPELLACLLARLPEEQRNAVGIPAMQKLLQSPRLPEAAELETLFALFPAATRETLCNAVAPYDGERDMIELERLRLLKRHAPARFAERLSHTVYPADALPALLQNPNRERCRNYLLTTMEFPDWALLAELSAPEILPVLTDAFCAALDELAATGTLSEVDRVRHLALLAISDTPSRRPLRLEAARRAHTRTGEASLWLLDALTENRQTEKAEQLRNLLSAEGKLPPSRQK